MPARTRHGALHQRMASLGAAEQDATWAAIGKALRESETQAGFVGPCGLVVVAGTKERPRRG